MNFKSVLLGTAAGLMVASGAYAADLPGEAAPAAVDYVKVCDAFGAGFFYIPGSDTCLKIKGRVRASAWYTGGDVTDSVTFRADAYVGFDARTASDLGTIRTYIELGSNADRSMTLDQAFIQIGYVTVGRQDDVADGDGLFGINDSTWGPGDYTATGISVLASDLGGGFYVGAGMYANSGDATHVVWMEDEDPDLAFSGIVGIADQSWGSADLSASYFSDPTLDDIYGVKGTVNFNVTDTLKARLWAAYTNFGDSVDTVDVAGAVAYQATDAASLYAGVRYTIVDGDDLLYANLGVDYSLAKNLNLQGEVDYANTGSADAFTVVTRLVRTW